MNSMNGVDDALEVVEQLLLRCTVMGVVVLLLWWGALALAGDLAYGIHSKIAPMTRQQFDLIHYVGMLAVKSGVSLLFFLPYIAVRLVRKKRSSGESSGAMS